MKKLTIYAPDSMQSEIKDLLDRYLQLPFENRQHILTLSIWEEQAVRNGEEFVLISPDDVAEEPSPDNCDEIDGPY